MAPEILEGKAYDARCDYWSFGIMWFQMICAVLPFKGCDKDEILAKIKVGKYEFPKDLNVTRLGRNFLKGCLKYDVNERFTWQQIINHPYITQNDFQKIKDDPRNLNHVYNVHENKAQEEVKGNVPLVNQYEEYKVRRSGNQQEQVQARSSVTGSGKVEWDDSD